MTYSPSCFAFLRSVSAPGLFYTTATFKARTFVFIVRCCGSPPSTPPINLFSSALVTVDGLAGWTRCLGWHWRRHPRNHTCQTQLTPYTLLPTLPSRSEFKNKSSTLALFLPSHQKQTWKAESLWVSVAVFSLGPVRSKPVNPHSCSVLTSEGGSKLDFSFSIPTSLQVDCFLSSSAITVF